jgi:hypothetical protein
MIKLGLEKRGVWTKLSEARSKSRNYDEMTQLHLASEAAAEMVGRVHVILELGWPGSINARDCFGNTPLILASYRGHSRIVKVLLAAGAEVNATNGGGETALICACSWNRLETARLLVSAKAFVNARSTSGSTPLNRVRGNPALAALLLAAGATNV